MGILCYWIAPLLAAFEADSLTGWRADLVARHVAGCAACQSHWEAQANLAALLRDAPPAPAAGSSAELWARIQPQLEPRTAASRPRLWLAPSVGVAACALFGVAIAARTGLFATPDIQKAPSPSPMVFASAPSSTPAPAPVKQEIPTAEEVIRTVERDLRGAGGDVPDPFEPKAADVQNRGRTLPPVAVGADLRSEMRGGGRAPSGRMTPVTPENYAMQRIVRPAAGPRVSFGGRSRGSQALQGGLHPDHRRTGETEAMVASDASAELSTAEREPTEAAAMADYQRSLFR